MTFDEAKRTCHVRSAIYRESARIRYWKNSIFTLDIQVPESDKLAMDWCEYDPRDEDDTSLFMFND
jgi:hypothetical protein